MRSLLVAMLLALPALLGACAPGDLADVHQGPPFVFDVSALPDAYQPWFAEAAGMWNEATGRDLIRVASNGQNRSAMSALPANAVGLTDFGDGDSITVLFDSTSYWNHCGTIVAPYHEGPDFRTVALHELGHVLGAHHIHPPYPAVMDAGSVGVCQTITPADLAAIRY